MPFDVTSTVVPVDLTVLATVTEGQWRHTARGVSPVVTLVTQLETHPDLDSVWQDLDAGTWEFTVARLDTALAVLGGIKTRITTLGEPTPEPPPTDVTDPVVTWQNPEDGEHVSGLVDLHFIIEDPSGIVSRDLTIAGVPHEIGTPWDTTLHANNTSVVLSLHAVDGATVPNETTSAITVIIDNVVPPIEPPPVSDVKRVIQMALDDFGHLTYALWVPVPDAIVVPIPGANSAWALATPAEDAALADGTIREYVETLHRRNMTDAQVQAHLQARWDQAVADLEALAVWPHENAYWTAAGWLID